MSLGDYVGFVRKFLEFSFDVVLEGSFRVL